MDPAEAQDDKHPEITEEEPSPQVEVVGRVYPLLLRRYTQVRVRVCVLEETQVRVRVCVLEERGKWGFRSGDRQYDGSSTIILHAPIDYYYVIMCNRVSTPSDSDLYLILSFNCKITYSSI